MSTSAELIEHVENLCGAGRYRSALDELAQLLRRQPKDEQVGLLARAVLLVGRTSNLTAIEPMTPQQYSSAVFAPLATQCSHCSRYWYEVLGQLEYDELGGDARQGAQCGHCLFTVCRPCGAQVGDRCPRPGCDGILETRAVPTGRRELVSVSADDIERVIVLRDGPIPPTEAEAFAVVSQAVPLVSGDAPLMLLMKGYVQAGISDPAQIRGTADALVARLEREGDLSRGALGRSTYLHLPETAADAAYLLIVVRLERAPLSTQHVDLLTTHLQRLLRDHPEPGPSWRRPCSGEAIQTAAGLMELAVRDAIDCRALATRSRLLPGLVLLATAIPTDVKCPAAFPTGHLDYIERFATSYGIQEHHLSLCDWVVLFDASNRVVDLTFLPADQADLTLFATDLLTPSERQLLGL